MHAPHSIIYFLLANRTLKVLAASERHMLLHISPCWQEVGPDIHRLIGHLKAAEDAVQGGALRMSVTGYDAILPKHLRTIVQTLRL